MKSLFFVLGGGGILALCFSACSTNRLVYTPEESDAVAFSIPEGESSVLTNPPKDKARVYAVRSKSIFGWAVLYNLYYQYDPEINAAGNEWVHNKDTYQHEIKNNVFGMSHVGAQNVMDFEIGDPLLLIGSTETYSYLIFTPRAGKIYCVELGITWGAWYGRPNLEFIDRTRCEKLYR